MPINIIIQDTRTGGGDPGDSGNPGGNNPGDNGNQNPGGSPGNPNTPPKAPNTGMITLFGNRAMPIWVFALLLALITTSSVAIFILLHRHHKQAHQFDPQEAVNRHLEKHIGHPTKAEHIDNLVISKLHFNHLAKLHSRKWGLTLAVPAVVIGLMLIVLPARAAVTDPYIIVTPQYNAVDITIDKADIPEADSDFTTNVPALVTTQTNIPTGYTLNVTGSTTDPKISLKLQDDNHSDLGDLNSTPIQLSQTSSADETGVAVDFYIDVTIASDIAVGTYSSTLTYDAQGDYFPTLANITPNKGSSAGGTVVTITGTNFTSDTAVYFGTITASNKCASLSLSNETTLTCTTPAGIAGTVDVAIITMGGQADLAGGYTFVAGPTITSVSPTAGPTTGGTPLTITGTNYDPTDTGLNVKVGGTDCPITSITSTAITCTTASSSAGQKDVVVTNGVGSSDSKTNAYNYLDAPTYNSINPGIGPLSGGATITVTGTNFDNITNTTAVTLGGQTCDQLNVQSATTLTCVVPATASAGPVSLVIATAGGTSSNADVYTYAAAPTIADVQPTNITSGTAITITGTNYIVGGTTVTIDGQTCTVTNVTTTSITCTAPTLSGGSLDVTVTTVGGSATANSSVNYHDSPTANVPTPGSGVVAGGTLITITGTNFDTTAGNTTVSVGGNNCPIQSITANQITCTTAGHSAGQVDVAVATTGGSVSLEGAFQYLAPPSLSAISPDSGSTGGGQSVTLTGTDFDTITNSNAVTIGGANCAITAVSDTTITCTTPAGALGAKTVTITTGGGSTSLPGAYTYLLTPGITSVSPNTLSLSGGNITIYGSNFVSGATTVQISGQDCTSVNVANANQLTCTAPSLAAGLASIAVTTSGGTGNGNNLLNYLPQPTITSVNPTGGLLAGGTPVTITGTGFDTVGGTNSVKIDNNTCTITNATATKITCTVPAGSSGAKDVQVDTAGGSTTSNSAYTYFDTPTGTQITPNYGSTAGGTTVTLTGTGLDNLNFVQFGTNSSDICTNINNQSATSLTCLAPAHAAGRVNIFISTAGGTDTITDGFNYLASPTLTSVTPNSGASTGGKSVTITGTGFDTLTNTTTVSFGGSVCNISNITTTSITCTTTAHDAGTVDVELTTGGGSTFLGAAYTYLAAPTITGVVQSGGAYSGVNAGQIAGNTPVTVTGTNFDTATNSNTISLGGSTCANITVVNPTQITCTTSAHSAGMVAAQITTAGGTNTLNSAYNYLSTPIISGVTPANISSGVQITITGGNYDHLTGTTSTLLNGTACDNPTITASTITCTTPTLSPGAVAVTITTAGGSITASSNPTYHDAPGIDAISPTSGPVNQATTITITGTNFVTGAGNTTVTIGGTNCGSVNVTSSSSLTCQAPAHAVGSVDVIINTVGGSDTAYGGFTYVPTPTIDSVSPGYGPLAGGTSVTITGSDFDTVTGSTVVMVGGNICANPSVQSATSLTCTLPAGTAGQKAVSVETTGGSSSKANAYEYLIAPTIATVSPNTGPTAGGTSVTITGTGFRNAANTSVVQSVLVGTNSCTGVSVASATSLTCTVPASSLSPTNGAAPVSITTAGGTGSLAGAYTYKNPPTITGVSPNTGSTDGGETITITGTNFHNSLGSNIVTSVQIGGQTVTPIVSSSTQMTITAPAHATGSVNIAITTSDGTATGTGVYEYQNNSTPPAATPSSSWVKSNTTVSGTSAANIQIDLDTNMIPVINQADAGTNWADYDYSKWANAVTVTSATLAAHKADPIGTVIPEADILGYWVYVPRYEYQVCRPLPSTTPAASAAASGCPTTFFTPYAFNINFQTASQKTAYNGTTVGGWATHPAFTFGTTELNGIWVGKFEATGTASAPTIKPNATSLKSQTISAQFSTSQSIRAQHSLNTDKDTRMAKNSDWGAISYLATSTYGRWGASSGNEVYINNNSNYTTGCAGATVSAASATTCNAYNTTAGVHASTTDNVYGIYDMSGGAYENTLSNYGNTAGSGGTIPAAKYVNVYPSATFSNDNQQTNYNQCTWALCGGHGLYETTTVQSVQNTTNNSQAWFGDYTRFVYSPTPWADRGGYHSVITGGAGLFSSFHSSGAASTYIGFRAVLSSQ
ncbi:hypothetical protein FACS189431_2090 [Alphaproteobacteria bacterium]|nr:hypothetical protein FACS189431_2090 [Alphaproteobacteria bacterium]